MANIFSTLINNLGSAIHNAFSPTQLGSGTLPYVNNTKNSSSTYQYGQINDQLGALQNKYSSTLAEPFKNETLIKNYLASNTPSSPASSNSSPNFQPPPASGGSQYAPPTNAGVVSHSQADPAAAASLAAMFPSMMQHLYTLQHPTPPAAVAMPAPSSPVSGGMSDIPFLSQLLPDVYGNLSSSGSQQYYGGGA